MPISERYAPRGRYRHSDPVLAYYLIRLAVEQRKGDYLGFPQRKLFDKIGVRPMVIETDPYGDFLTQGYDLGPIYDDFFWINGDGALPVPKDAYYMAGAGSQYTLIISSYDLVVVRLGHFQGEQHAHADLAQALALLMRAVPAHSTKATLVK